MIRNITFYGFLAVILLMCWIWNQQELQIEKLNKDLAAMDRMVYALDDHIIGLEGIIANHDKLMGIMETNLDTCEGKE